MRLLIINPNTTDAMTEKVRQASETFLPMSWTISAFSGSFGPRYIASRAAFAVAGHAALDAFAAHGGGADIVLLACFGDPGLDALREVAEVPVIGLVEASARQASRGGRRFSIVTGGVLWEPMLRESLVVRGLTEYLASIRTVAPDGSMIAHDPDGAIALLAQACLACVREDGADAVILGGVGMLGLAEPVGRLAGVDVICSVMAGLEAVVASARTVQVGPQPRPVDSVGLSQELRRLLGAPQEHH
ncbi:MAG: aspartate/glutamate racemase family protein [Beijerinckiaceae bacterium]